MTTHSTVQSHRDKAKVYRTRCDQRGCGAPAVLLSSLCYRHMRAKKYRGHPLATDRMLMWKEVEPVWRLVRKLFSKKFLHPPEVVQALERNILSPHASLTIRRTEDWKPGVLATARRKLRDALDWWRNPASAKKWRKGAIRWRYDPQSILTALLAVTLYCDERTWGRGDTPNFAHAMVLLKMRNLRHRSAISYKTGTSRTRTTTVPANVRRLLGQLLAETVGVYLLTTARAIIEQQVQANAENIKRTAATPRHLSQAEYHAMWEKQKANKQRAEDAAREAKYEFAIRRQLEALGLHAGDTLPPLGERLPWDGSTEGKAGIEAYFVRQALWKRFPTGVVSKQL